MLSVNVVVIGKLKESHLVGGCAEYVKRLSAYCKINIIELPASKIVENPSQSQIDMALEEEANKIIVKVAGSYVVSLCIEGTLLSSEQLSQRIEIAMNEGTSCISFVIGGSHGLSDRVKTLSTLKMSMSKMTFPHQLARMMLLEQIYRALSISNGSKYHK